ncbi:MAG: 2-octaprenyl-6-methoxyphenyl hydroxylase [Idiomarina sp. 34-48-12]|nr:MAG: 2-octaprenyl-6-methoxyphenyl hydroxylase [Idiomarina sp. 34-48-12]
MDDGKISTVNYPVVIAGGGLVGALTALLLARGRQDWRIAVLEPQEQGPAQDKRTIALAAATVALLEQIGVWQQVAEKASPIEHIHVSDRGHLGMTRLHAAQHGVAAMGQVIAAAALNRALYEACLQETNIEWLGGAWFERAEREPDAITVHYKQQDSEAQLTAQLLIGADGQRSQVRSDAAIGMHHTDYQQVGIIATLTLSQDLDGWAYERFTDTGPVALLPLPDQQASLVWSLSPEQAEQTMQLSDADFLAACQCAFGYRAGRFTAVRDRVQYPLQLHLAESNICHRSVIIGNASHTLHPIAGQGFNLGVRDAIELSALLIAANDPGSYRLLSEYNQQRQTDYQRIIRLTDSLVRGFSNQHVPLVIGRNLALFGLDNLPPIRHLFARQTMGFRNA